MTLEITAALAGAASPQAVQVVATGLTPGQPFEVTKSWAGGSLGVRGGSATAEGTQVVLGDLVTPINVPLTYSVEHAGETATSSPVTVPYPGEYVLQSLDGQLAVEFEWHGNQDPREEHLRTAVFEVAGRTDPVVRWDLSAGESDEIQIRTEPPATRALLEQLRTRGPVMVLRTDAAQADFEAVRIVVFARATRRLFAFEGTRLWSLYAWSISDPEPGTVVPVASWEDFDAYYAAKTWDDFDAQWAGASWDDFDRFDWVV